MLVAEYDYDTDIAVQRQESLMIGIRQGSYRKALETAKLMKSRKYPISDICAISGLSCEEIEKL